MFDLYSRPESGYRYRLLEPPRLASWDAGTAPSQLRLADYRKRLKDALDPAIAELEGDLSLGLTVALDPAVPEGDLDNYLTPVLDALGRERFAAVWAEKAVAGESAVVVTQATRFDPSLLADWSFADVVTHSSSSRPQWKDEIASQLVPSPTATSESPLELVLAFRLSPARDWVWIWKPAIDALGGILGQGARAWHPRDDRIVRLGLHRTWDTSLGWSIRIGIWWREARPAGLAAF
jgi:hypothetical protein